MFKTVQPEAIKLTLSTEYGNIQKISVNEILLLLFYSLICIKMKQIYLNFFNI